MAEIPNSRFDVEFELRRQETPSDFIALDVRNLTKSLSGKGDAAAFAINGGVHASEKHAAARHVEASDEPIMLPRTSTTAAVSGGGKYRRMGSSSRRLASPWLGPRRVMLVFAGLSSMGTLILLYFTLSMGKMPGSDADAR